MLAEAEQQGRVKIIRESSLSRILPHCVQIVAGKKVFELPNDYVFVLIGGESPEEFLRKIGIEMVEKVLGVEEVHASFA